MVNRAVGLILVISSSFCVQWNVFLLLVRWNKHIEQNMIIKFNKHPLFLITLSLSFALVKAIFQLYWASDWVYENHDINVGNKAESNDAYMKINDAMPQWHTMVYEIEQLLCLFLEILTLTMHRQPDNAAEKLPHYVSQLPSILVPFQRD